MNSPDKDAVPLFALQLSNCPGHLPLRPAYGYRQEQRPEHYQGQVNVIAGPPIA